MIEPVHQLAETTQNGRIVRTKCGLNIDRKHDKTTRASGWATDIDCPDCLGSEKKT